jgi:hypothetical protein
MIDSDPIFIRVSGRRILLKNTKFYSSTVNASGRPEEFDEKILISMRDLGADLVYSTVYFPGSVMYCQ